jgi:2-polyprenyl-3-methyl-5-hydroxy-6-metoxy-1,4-benzoquinol methylase
MQTTQSEYQYSTERLDHTYNYLAKPLLSMLPQSSTAQKIRVLDLGCGNGSFANVLAKMGYEVVGVEESASGIKIAQQNYPDCQFICGSIYELSELNLENDFDVIISIEVIEHLFYPRALPDAAKSLLKPEGKLIITTPYHGYLKNIALSLAGKMDSHFTALWDGGHIKFFSVQTLTQLLNESNFTDIEFDFVGRFPYLWKSMLCTCKARI